MTATILSISLRCLYVSTLILTPVREGTLYKITGRDYFDKVVDSIQCIAPVIETRANRVVLRSEINDLDDFIPDDDLIYNLIEQSPYYKKIKLETNRYRLNILEIWDKNRLKYCKELHSILKFDLKKEYKVCVVHPNLEVVETNFDTNLDTNIITIGKKIITRDKDNFLTYLVYKIIKNEILKLKTIEKEILEVVIELAITNELYTRVTKESKYKIGKKELRDLKEKIYPYWLMYLGVKETDFESYMIRDNIFFDKKNYSYEKLLKTIDIYSFIAFLIKNKKAIFKTKLVPVENIELL